MKANEKSIHGFKKSERITEKKLISQLFKEGKSIFLYPLLIKCLPQSGKDIGTNKVLISVSSRKIRKAVDRNLIKRRIREAFRLNKLDFNSPNHLYIAYIYVSEEVLPFSTIQVKLKESLQRLSISSTEAKK